MVIPEPSITRASAGTVTFAPTAWMTPRETTIVPLGIGGPETGTIRAFLMAKYGGSSARARCAATTTHTITAQATATSADRIPRIPRARITDSFETWLERFSV